MNRILEKWTLILTNGGSPRAETHGILSNTADGFRRHGEIHDGLSTRIIMLEDAKMTYRHIYTAYSDFKGAFGGVDHGNLFQTMRELGFPE